MAALMGHRNTFPLSSPSSHHWTFFLGAAFTVFSQVLCFNLDTTHTLHKLGDRGTFFGFSVALHQQLVPESQSWWVDCKAQSLSCVTWGFVVLYLHLPSPQYRGIQLCSVRVSVLHQYLIWPTSSEFSPSSELDENEWIRLDLISLCLFRKWFSWGRFSHKQRRCHGGSLQCAGLFVCGYFFYVHSSIIPLPAAVFMRQK